VAAEVWGEAGVVVALDRSETEVSMLTQWAAGEASAPGMAEVFILAKGDRDSIE
jgi:hypothetical protein